MTPNEFCVNLTHKNELKTRVRRCFRTLVHLTVCPARLAKWLAHTWETFDSWNMLGAFLHPTIQAMDGLVEWNHVQPKLVKLMITTETMNAHVLTYKRRQFKQKVLLKSINRLSTSLNLETIPDNLYYEYLVGRFLNRYVATGAYPCFVQTYGIYVRHNRDDTAFAGSKTVPAADVYDKLSLLACDPQVCGFPNATDLETDLKVSVAHHWQLALLTQYVPHAQTFKKYLKTDITPRHTHWEDDPEWGHLLFQVYAPLAALQHVFTHYDLHDNNVLLHELPNNTYVILEYVHRGTIVRFKTHLIAKIIDYGRSYFWADADTHSQAFYETLCRVCPERGYWSGFHFTFNRTNFHHIRSVQSNPSHDLRLMHIVQERLNECDQDTRQGYTATLVDDVYYQTNYGTPRCDYKTGYIANVGEAADALAGRIMNPAYGFQAANDARYAGMTCRGVFTYGTCETPKPSGGSCAKPPKNEAVSCAPEQHVSRHTC